MFWNPAMGYCGRRNYKPPVMGAHGYQIVPLFKPGEQGDVVAQLVERRPRDPMGDSMTRGSNPVRSTQTISESFSESKWCTDSLSVCPTPHVYTQA